MCKRRGERVPCASFFEQGGCERSGDCSWHAGAFACLKNGETPPCDAFFVEEACVDATECQWASDAAACLPLATWRGAGLQYVLFQ